MEDNFICTGFYAYSFRLDKIEETNIVEEIQWIIQKTKRHLLRLEKGDITKKEHLQGILWFKEKLKTREIIKYRNHFRREKGGISFISAKKVKSLSAYCNKTTGKLISNLSIEQMALVPSWVNEKTNWKIDLQKKLEELEVDIWEPHCQQEFVCAIIHFYIENKKSPPNRNMLYKYLLNHYNHYKNNDYICDINLFLNKY